LKKPQTKTVDDKFIPENKRLKNISYMNDGTKPKTVSNFLYCMPDANSSNLTRNVSAG